jgi:hypothetical protein
MDEYALDFLDPDSRRLVNEMLSAVVEHPNVHTNGVNIRRSKSKSGGFEYFLSAQGDSMATPFRQGQFLLNNIIPLLLHHGFLGEDVGEDHRGWPFTDAAFQWYRMFGGPNADQVRKRIGRFLAPHIGNRVPPMYSAEEVAAAINVPLERVRRETHILLGAGLLYTAFSELGGGREFGAVALSEPEGVRWLAGDCQPIGSLGTSITNVAVSLGVEVQTVLQQVRTAEVPPQVLESFEARLRRVEEELAKENGEGDYEKVRDLIETANTSKDLLGSVVPLLAKHWDKIQTFADAAGNILPG